jgi:hypothetical protein
MSGVIAMEGQLNCIVKEVKFFMKLFHTNDTANLYSLLFNCECKYLDYFGFDSTLLKFNEECNQKGKSIANLENRQGSNQKINIMIVIDFNFDF